MISFTGFKTIVLSRIKKIKETKEIKQKREICKHCEYNSLNIDKTEVKLNKRILKRVSDFYSWVTGNSEEDILGNCYACEACSIFYKTNSEGEICPKDKWKSIYIPNSAKKKIKYEK